MNTARRDTARQDSARLAELLRCEHRALAEFLVALARFDQERGWAALDHTSLFYYLHRELGLPKGPAFYRKTAAELIQRYPEIVEPLRDGRLHLTSIVELAKVITPENCDEVVPRFFHASKREAKEVSAALQPVAAPPLRTVVTAVHPPALLALGPAAPAVLPEEPARVGVGAPAVASPPQATVQPLTADLRRLHLTVSRRLLDKLGAARDALSHSHPGASEDEILEVGLDLILERQAKRRGIGVKARTPKAPSPRPSPPLRGGEGEHHDRYVPADVRRAVWKRDRGRCQWKLANGELCGSTVRVELDHVVPVGRGGASTVENLRCLCRIHNDRAAREVYGDAHMDGFTAPWGRCSEPVVPWPQARLAFPSSPTT